MSVPITFQIGINGSATVTLPHTGQAALSPLTATYAVTWMRGKFPVTPRILKFALPQEFGASVDYDTLQPSPDVPGVAVPMAVSVSALTAASSAATAAQASASAAATSAASAQSLTQTAANAATAAAASAAASAAFIAADVNNIIVSRTNPHLTQPGLWIQTGINGTGITFWIEDGT